MLGENNNYYKQKIFPYLLLKEDTRIKLWEIKKITKHSITYILSKLVNDLYEEIVLNKKTRKLNK